MLQTQFEAKERELAEDRSSNFRGTAIVQLRSLEVANKGSGEFADKGSREINWDNVKRLTGIFKSDGCRRSNPKHHILATIDQQNLDQAMLTSNVDSKLLLENPKDGPPELIMPPDYRLECLDGRHRIEAGKEYLMPGDMWWTVEIYLDDMKPETKRALAEEYSRSIDYSDGEIYRKIRQYSDDFARGRWLARLTYSKQKDLRQLNRHRRFAKALDSLLVIPGLWEGLNLGMLHKIMAMKCDEEIVQYLRHILETWSSILGNNEMLMGKIDQATVKALQLRAPGISKEDLMFLQNLLAKDELFPALNRREKQGVWKNLCTITCPIPSIYTFHQDIKYLQPCAKVMKRLLDQPVKKSVRKAVTGIFSGCNQTEGNLTYQTTEGSYKCAPANETQQMEYGYRQLWLYSMRNFPEMVGACPKKEDGQPTPMPKQPDETIWYYFASLADILGFKSQAIDRLKSKNPDMEIAMAALLKARPLHLFNYDPRLIEPFLDEIVRMFNTAKRIAGKPTEPTLLVDRPGETIERRCGRTYQNAHADDRLALFLEPLHEPQIGRGEGISSFFVRRSVYNAFFGIPLLPSSQPYAGIAPQPCLSQYSQPTIKQTQSVQHRDAVVDQPSNDQSQTTRRQESAEIAPNSPNDLEMADIRHGDTGLLHFDPQTPPVEPTQIDQHRGLVRDQLSIIPMKSPQHHRDQSSTEFSQGIEDLPERETPASPTDHEMADSFGKDLENEFMKDWPQVFMLQSFLSSIMELILKEDPPLTVYINEEKFFLPPVPNTVRKKMEVANKRGYVIKNNRQQLLKPDNCFESVKNDNTFTIHLIPSLRNRGLRGQGSSKRPGGIRRARPSGRCLALPSPNHAENAAVTQPSLLGHSEPGNTKPPQAQAIPEEGDSATTTTGQLLLLDAGRATEGNTPIQPVTASILPTEEEEEEEL